MITKTEYKRCPNCGGTGRIPDMNSTAIETTCPLCWGSGMVIEKIVTEEVN